MVRFTYWLLQRQLMHQPLIKRKGKKYLEILGSVLGLFLSLYHALPPYSTCLKYTHLCQSWILASLIQHDFGNAEDGTILKPASEVLYSI
jgi:hypothetical protein